MTNFINHIFFYNFWIDELNSDDVYYFIYLNYLQINNLHI